MGVHNIRLESEVFALPQFQYQGWTPVETKPEYGSLQQLVSQLTLVQIGLNQIQQTLAAQGQWRIPSPTPVETKIDPTLTGGLREAAQFHIPSRTPVETKVDPSLLHQVAAQLTEAGQTFTRLAEAAVEGQNLVEEVRKLNQRVEELGGKAAKGK
jgi:hypothetical protein